MNKYFILTKTLLLQQFRAKPITKVNKTNGKVNKGNGAKIAIIIAMVVGFLPLAAMIISGAYVVGTLHLSLDSRYTVTFIMLIIQALVLLFGLPSLISGVFAPKDGDKLLYLPASTATLFASKLTIAYINELITAVLGVLILLLPFGIGANMGIAFYVLLLPTVLLLPVLPLTIGCIISLPVSALTRRLSRIPMAKTIFSVLVFVLAMGAYMYGFYSMTSFMDNMDAVTGNMTPDQTQQYLTDIVVSFISTIDKVMPYFLPNYLMAIGITATTIGAVALYTLGGYASCAVLLLISVLLAMTTYRKNMSSEQEGSGSKGKNNTNKNFVYGSKGVLPMLMWTNAKRFFRDSQISMQLIMSLVMPIFIVVVFGISFSMGADSDDAFVFDKFVLLIISVALLGYLTLLCGASNILAVFPFSLERSKMYLLKIMPVPVETILLSKVLLSTTIITAEAILCAIAAVVVLGISWYSAVMMCISLAIYQFGTMCITTYIDICNPKLDWENYQSGLKNAKNSWISLLCGLAVMLAIGIASAMFIVWCYAEYAIYKELLMWLAIIVVGIIYSNITYRHMTFHGKKAFENIEL